MTLTPLVVGKLKINDTDPIGRHDAAGTVAVAITAGGRGIPV